MVWIPVNLKYSNIFFNFFKFSFVIIKSIAIYALSKKEIRVEKILKNEFQNDQLHKMLKWFKKTSSLKIKKTIS